MKKENIEELNYQAIKLTSNGDFNEAVACLNRAIMIESYNHILWYNLGITYRSMGKLQEAKQALEKAFKLKSTDPAVIEVIADLCFSMHDYEDALAYCTIGLEQNNLNSTLWNITGVVFFNLEDYENACEAFEQAIFINPYDYDAIFNLRDTYEEMGNEIGKIECERKLKQIKNKEI